MAATATATTAIREATLDDVPAIARMGARFATSEYQRLLTVNPRAIAELARHVLASPDALGLVVERDGVVVGMLGMTVYTQQMSGETIATELCWWMEPEVRGGSAALRMLERGKAWARAKGATRLQMIAPNEHVGSYYERLGFERVEIHYQIGLA